MIRNELLEQLGKSQNPSMNEWHNTIKLFYQTYDKVMKVNKTIFGKGESYIFLIETIKKKDKK